LLEESSTNDLFYEPLHPYTRVLLNSIPGFHRRNRKKEPKLPLKRFSGTSQDADFTQDASIKCLYANPLLH